MCLRPVTTDAIERRVASVSISSYSGITLDRLWENQGHCDFDDTNYGQALSPVRSVR